MATVLVVDDEKVIREGCKRAFAAQGFRVLTASSGREALDLLAVEEVNVIVCDLKMPVMGALAVMQDVSARFPDLPIIIVTGQGSVANAVECMRAGAYEFITKPFRIGQLIELVRRAMEGSPPPARFPHDKMPF